MFTKRTRLSATVLTIGLLATACGSPVADDNSGGDVSSEAEAAAKALGIDLSQCPTDVTQPLGKTVKVGNTMPLTGPVAPALGVIGPGLKAAFDNFNKTSGLDTTFQLVSEDDAFTPDKALTSTQTLLDKDDIDLMTTVIATAQVVAVRGILGEECVPFLPGVSGGASANDPADYPWTAVFSQPSALDSRIMMADITANHPDGAKVAVLYSNTESGKDYLDALKKYAGKNQIVKTETIEATETAAPSSQITTLRSSGADTLIAIPTSAQCASTMQEAANQGWDVPSYITSTCSSATFDVAGQAADGWHITTYVKDPSRGEGAKDPAVLEAVDLLHKSSPDTPINNTSLGGFLYSQPLFEAIKEAADSPLGLSRLGIMSAFSTLDFQPALLKDGVRFKLDGLEDHEAMEASYMSVYDAKSKTFTDSDLYDFEGQMGD
ncbi:ABC transporter substrate-binding protein [Nocardioides acrostichi]|uniref:ABC transporter substrate-binding protein n=1 Tax=Nocardioides acrostichi TaxID=2784339 RepID=A0A930YBR0_9ACTN|nr:ABC transporter substrate-binding protein [Nocardioides acrostichi]MBF4162728.1 ABC transporter substrate-binding protein [Nocardioides acrostichi]